MFKFFKKKSNIIDLTKKTKEEKQEKEEKADNFLLPLALAAGESSENREKAKQENTPEIYERLTTLSSRIHKLIERIDLLEHKIERLERKFG